MHLTRTNRRGLALLTAVLLLWCQASYALHAQAPGAAQAAAAAAPCDHGGTAGDSGQGRKSAGDCEVANAFVQEVRLPVLAPGEVPTAAAAPLTHCVSPGPQTATAGMHRSCRSPPLTLLHCRLLI